MSHSAASARRRPSLCLTLTILYAMLLVPWVSLRVEGVSAVVGAKERRQVLATTSRPVAPTGQRENNLFTHFRNASDILGGGSPPPQFTDQAAAHAGEDFSAKPAPPTKGAPPGFIDQDQERRQRQDEPSAPIFSALSLPGCGITCGGDEPPPAGGDDPYFGTARNRLENETGRPDVDLGSKNFNWGTTLVSLPGRAGLDLNISLYYNSLVWTRQGTAIMYNADHSFPAPGFRLGFPTLQQRYFNSDARLFAYVMITSSGGRVEMRQVGRSGTYDSADGSYIQLIENADGSRTVRTSDGAQFKFIYFTSLVEYRCTEIKDRNGNYITIQYGAINGNTTLGRPTKVIDTLGREINFNYDAQNYLTSITQQWRRELWSNGQIVAQTETHTWASFNYDSITLQPNFRDQQSGAPLSVYATTGTPIPVMASVGFADASFYEFFYESGWGIVKQINRRAPNRLLSYTAYQIPATGTVQSDCPRVTESRQWAQFWNGDTDAAPAANEEAVTKYRVAADDSWTKVIFPDGTMHKELFATSAGWQKGLLVGSEDWTADEDVGGTKKKWTTLSWTQDLTTPISLTVGDAGFENPYVGYGQYQNAPAGGAWTFNASANGAAGLSGNNSAVTNGNDPAPEGGQVAFIYGGADATIAQAINGFQGGVPYTLAFFGAQRRYANTYAQSFDVYLDDVPLQTFQPYYIGNSAPYSEQSTTFTTSPGTHTLKFVGRSISGTDTALIDNLRITATPNVQLNPRIVEANIYDAEGNRKRTTMDYTTTVAGASAYCLPTTVREYDHDGQAVLRRTDTSYRWDAALVDKHVIGLTSVKSVYEGDGASLAARMEYAYDWVAGYLDASPSSNPTVQHDPAYDANYTGRGVLVGVYRHSVIGGAGTWIQTLGYNLAGATIWTADGSNHRTEIGYADSFSDGNNGRATFAYPTSVTDPDQVGQPTPSRALAQYNFDTGALFSAQTPAPAGGAGPAIVRLYDAAGRPERFINQANGAYTRFEYDINQGHTRTYTTITSLQSEAYTNTIVDGMGQVNLVVNDHPGSVGGYRTMRTQYDNMGRMTQHSNMTEINSGGVPAGDDGQAGYQWTVQAYDWKGRPTLTINPDGSTTELTYGGCGCAGSEMVMARDERGRRKRYTKDALGRLSKVEEMNWDGTNVYATTRYTLNARDQITNIDQEGLPRTFEYDGQGRLSAETTPEQGRRAFSYNADDTVLKATDARGAAQTFGYNGRHLVTSIVYGSGLKGTLPKGVAPTPNVSFAYDVAGNRTSMSDGMGSVTYAYDGLSRLTTEKRTFNGLTGPNSGKFQLSYSYNLAGELESMTNPWGAQVGYAYDTDGRATRVTGSNYANVAFYAHSLQYRAFDSLKALTYGNGRTLAVGYDNRMRVNSWAVPNVLGWEYSYADVAENTGRVMFAKNTYSSTMTGGTRDATLDRSYDYDHLGRLVVSHTGYEARLHMNRQQPGDPTDFGPYSHHYNYDKWGNLTQREGWGGWNPSYTYSYAGNRNTALQYDAAGNVTNDGQTFTYDAAERQATSYYAPNGWDIRQSYDGYGQRAKKTEDGKPTYYLRSSVLGAQVVCEIDGDGAWQRGYVYLGGQLLAMQERGAVEWVHQDPVTKSQRVTGADGATFAAVDLDPWGGETSKSANQFFQPHRFTTYERDQNGRDQAGARQYQAWFSRFDQPDPYDGSYDLSDPQSFNHYAYVKNDPVNFVDPSGMLMAASTSCYVDGMPTNCSTAISLINSGAGYVQHAGFYLDGNLLITNEYGFRNGEPVFTGQRAYWLGGPENQYPIDQEPLQQRRAASRSYNEYEQSQIDFRNCARAAWRAYRKEYLRTSFMAAVGGAGLGVGISSFLGVRAGGVGLGILGARHALADTALSNVGRLMTAGDELFRGGAIGSTASLLSGKVALDAIRDARRNSSKLDAALKECDDKSPFEVDVTWSFLTL